MKTPIRCQHCDGFASTSFNALSAHMRTAHDDVIDAGIQSLLAQGRLDRGEAILVDEFGRTPTQALWGSPPAGGWRAPSTPGGADAVYR